MVRYSSKFDTFSVGMHFSVNRFSVLQCMDVPSKYAINSIFQMFKKMQIFLPTFFIISSVFYTDSSKSFHHYLNIDMHDIITNK